MLNETVLTAMNKLNRVFDRDDVIVAMEVHVIDHRRERSRFTGTGRPGYKDETFLQHRKFFQHRWKTEVIGRQHLRWNGTKGGRDSVFLLKEIDAISHHVRNFIAKIDIEPFFE